jgi:hypothetical protein
MQGSGDTRVVELQDDWVGALPPFQIRGDRVIVLLPYLLS